MSPPASVFAPGSASAERYSNYLGCNGRWMNDRMAAADCSNRECRSIAGEIRNAVATPGLGLRIHCRVIEPPIDGGAIHDIDTAGRRNEVEVRHEVGIAQRHSQHRVCTHRLRHDCGWRFDDPRDVLGQTFIAADVIICRNRTRPGRSIAMTFQASGRRSRTWRPERGCPRRTRQQHHPRRGVGLHSPYRTSSLAVGRTAQ
jgi:hypothetical protein